MKINSFKIIKFKYSHNGLNFELFHEDKKKTIVH